MTGCRGENKAALEIAKRERIPTDGPKYDIYGLDEEALWEKIESMDEWWKDSTYVDEVDIEGAPGLVILCGLFCWRS